MEPVYLIIRYRGKQLSSNGVVAVSSTINNALGGACSELNVVQMGQVDVAARLANFGEQKSPELSPVEAACIYAKSKFGVYFESPLKLTLSLSEAVLNSRGKDSELISCIKILSQGVSNRMRVTYGVTPDVISVFKQIYSNLQ